eukprot:3346060-Prymnesium_polylepis.2
MSGTTITGAACTARCAVPTVLAVGAAVRGRAAGVPYVRIRSMRVFLMRPDVSIRKRLTIFGLLLFELLCDVLELPRFELMGKPRPADLAALPIDAFPMADAGDLG